MRILNMTPHTVSIYSSREDGAEATLVIPSCAQQGIPVPRCSQRDIQVDSINGVPVFETTFGEVVDLPEMQEGVVLIVSRIVFNAAHRPDLVTPGPAIRNSEGVIVGSLGLSR